jgi:predicted deacetylase
VIGRASTAPRIAVALHDIEPSTFERCALIRDWLDDHGVDRITLLVVPAYDLHPFHDRSPELAEWVSERVALGDAVAQHGFQHRQLRRSSGLRRTVARRQHGPGSPEFVGLDEGETRRAVAAGRRVLKLAGIVPRGFVAPAYAYTAGLERVLAPTFDWWASLHRLVTQHGQHSAYLPAMSVGPDGARSIGGRLASPWGVRASALLAGPLLRLDLHPQDLDQRGRIAAAEQVLRRAGSRQAVTYDDLALDLP